ncbi:MAG: type II toxin-antitoxin system prevent-host-death family antitoxin [Nitrospiraceae bacterium]|jgi:prevent-host-death family protein|nr:type II toxin-antitoxin system prevent-host-death family antitoxin [Nitrospira sp.]TKB71343.1 MAG: type II toxin-antitoxin system prevent-host-death family antitoxin [Nitrospira sp.]TSA04883.1 MAG: type II toxin-antitoxin system prevent-host-death family antitoxin [Nitrospiraceae bacterium]
MPHVGVRELKNRLSRYLKRVQGGEEIVVTERGQSVARIVPVNISSLKRALEPMLREGAVRWSGGKPRGASRRPVIRGRTLADMVIEDRR